MSISLGFFILFASATALQPRQPNKINKIDVSKAATSIEELRIAEALGYKITDRAAGAARYGSVLLSDRGDKAGASPGAAP